ncbi:hypothetical protein ABVT39_008497 [Epinephelus coioides]
MTSYKCVIPYLSSTVAADAGSGAGIMYHDVCQIIRQLVTAPRRAESGGKSLKLDLCNGRICKSSLHLHFSRLLR